MPPTTPLRVPYELLKRADTLTSPTTLPQEEERRRSQQQSYSHAHAIPPLAIPPREKQYREERHLRSDAGMIPLLTLPPRRNLQSSSSMNSLPVPQRHLTSGSTPVLRSPLTPRTPASQTFAPLTHRNPTMLAVGNSARHNKPSCYFFNYSSDPCMNTVTSRGYVCQRCKNMGRYNPDGEVFWDDSRKRNEDGKKDGDGVQTSLQEISTWEKMEPERKNCCCVM